MSRLSLYAIARSHGGHLEYYMPLSDGHDVGWTLDLAEAWCIETLAWAEMVRLSLMRHGFYNTFVHPFHEDR